MILEILSAEQQVYSGEVDSVIFPGSEGEFQILNNHAPLISSLKNGTIKYSSNKKIHSLEVSGGIVEVLNNKVNALIEKQLTFCHALFLAQLLSISMVKY